MFRKLAITAIIVVGACATAQADYIVNGQFAAPGITPSNNSWNLFSSITGWYPQQYTNPGDSVSENNPIEVGSPSVYGLSGGVGNNLELNSDAPSEVSQNIAGLSAGQVLNVSFLDGYRFDPSNPTVNTNSFNVLWNGNVVGSYLPTSSTMTLQSLNVTALAGTNVLSFESTSPVESSYGGEIEDVMATPEPAPIAALGLGFGLMGLIRRRRK